jgi:hypothetical protein
VYVGVHYDNPFHEALRLHRAGRDRAVVEHAVALAPISEGVVGAPGQVRREAVFERGQARSQSAARGPSRALDHSLGPREANAAHLFLR